MTFRSMFKPAAVGAVILLGGAPRFAAAQSRGMLGRESLDLANLCGKVVDLDGFPSWCPGCRSHGFPLHERYRDADDVAFVAVPTALEGNTPARGRATEGERSRFMADHRTGGTPSTIIIGPEGVVRYNDLGIGIEQGAALIGRPRPRDAGKARQLATGEPENRGVRTVPASRGGQDLVGTPFPELEFDRWARREGTGDAGAEPRVTLYRWWTDQCPFCAASAPAIESLRERYEPQGLRVVAVYHPKPARGVPDEEILRAAERLGFGGEIAVDEDWSALHELWLSTGRRDATSASFLVDERGIIRFVHPGPQFFSTDDPGFAQENADYKAMDEAVKVLLSRQGQPRED